MLSHFGAKSQSSPTIAAIAIIELLKICDAAIKSKI
jgi:hypothetical protein